MIVCDRLTNVKAWNRFLLINEQSIFLSQRQLAKLRQPLMHSLLTFPYRSHSLSRSCFIEFDNQLISNKFNRKLALILPFQHMQNFCVPPLRFSSKPLPLPSLLKSQEMTLQSSKADNGK